MSQAELLEKYFFLQRQAVDALIELLKARDFDDANLAINTKTLGELCHHQEAIILGRVLDAAEQVKVGNWDALELVENYISLGMGAHKNSFAKPSHIGGLMHLKPILEAIKVAAFAMPAWTAGQVRSHVKRVGIVVSNLSPGAATSLVARKLAASLHALGLETHLLLTEHGALPNCEIGEIANGGVFVLHLQSKNIISKVQENVNRMRHMDFDAVIYFAWPTDIVAQICSCVRTSFRQVFINHTCDQKVGDFDVRVCCTKETTRLTDPDRCRYVPPVRVLEEAYTDVAKAQLGQWGIEEGSIIVGNYSRLSKCIDEPFMAAMVKVLRNNRSVVLVLPGLPDPQSEEVLKSRFDSEGLLSQVRFPGFLSDMYLPLLKTTHIYCDTFSWKGGQSVMDAMAMGVPVVSSKPSSSGSALDPTGVSPVSLASTFLPDQSLVANVGDVDGYVAIVQRLLDDPTLHEKQANLNIERSKELAWQKFPNTILGLLNQITQPQLRPVPDALSDH